MNPTGLTFRDGGLRRLRKPFALFAALFFALFSIGRLMAKSAAPVTYLMITRGSLIRIPGFVARVVT